MFDTPATKPSLPSPAEVARFLRDGSGGGIESCSNKPSMSQIAVMLYKQGMGKMFCGGGNK